MKIFKDHSIICLDIFSYNSDMNIPYFYCKICQQKPHYNQIFVRYTLQIHYFTPLICLTISPLLI